MKTEAKRRPSVQLLQSSSGPTNGRWSLEIEPVAPLFKPHAMPLYEYQCVQCSERVEILQRMSDPPYSHCPKCGGDMKKLHSSPAIQFKGSGFYKTDYASGKSESKSESSSEAKSESKPATKSDGSSGASGE